MKNAKWVVLFTSVTLLTALSFGCNKKPESVSSEAAAQKTSKESPEAAGDKEEEKEMPMEATGPVAIVDGKEISAERYNKQVENHLRRMPFAPPAAALEMYKTRILDMVIDEYLIESTLEKENVEVPAQEVDNSFNKFREQFPSDEAFAGFLKENQITEDVIRGDISKDLALRQLMAKANNIEITDDDIRKHYDTNKKEFEIEEQVRASHILLKIEANDDEEKAKAVEAKANELATKAKLPDADFAAMAKEDSTCPSGQNGGDLNFFEMGRMVPEFGKAAFAMKVGEVSDPVRTQFGYHIIKVTDRKEGRNIPFDEAKDDIKSQLESNALRTVFPKFMESLKEDLTIERKEDNIVIHLEIEEDAAPRGMQMPLQIQQ